jgi:hypothetical protein
MTDQRLATRILIALGGIQAGEGASAIQARYDALWDIKQEVADLITSTANELRVARALETAGKRLKPSHHHYGTHMSHCYGLNYDFHDFQPGKPTERHSCKYGEDDICPAALFEDPWAEWERMVGDKEVQ